MGNSGNFRIFEPSEWNLNLNSSDCRASKIIYSDTKLEPISWELNLKNRLFYAKLRFFTGFSPFSDFMLALEKKDESFPDTWTFGNQPKFNRIGKSCPGPIQTCPKKIKNFWKHGLVKIVKRMRATVRTR